MGVVKREDILAHIRDKSKHSLAPTSSGMLSLPENQTYRGNASGVAVATSVLKIYTDRTAITTDHSSDDVPQLVNIVKKASPGTLVAANTVPIGTLGIIYTP